VRKPRHSGYNQSARFGYGNGEEAFLIRAREFRTSGDIRTCRHRRWEGASDLMRHPSERTGSYPIVLAGAFSRK
jgi:hypothetical protein